ncbi:MAG: FAD-dependent oxidoreductase [Treponema sp.]|jgi:fumarate reductase flavoprotein subunit|nr:FAD-dependent oxidoreductase [Treponema sp.]
MKKMRKPLAGLIVLLIGLSLLAGCENGTTEKKQKIDKTYEADIVVVGGGGAGFSAALAALQAGKSVILLEQLAYTGGNTVLAGGAMNAAYTIDDDFHTPGTLTMNASNMQLVEEKIAMRAGDASYAHLNISAADVTKINAAMLPWQTALNTDWQKWKTTSTGFFDSPYLHILQTYEAGDFIAKPELVETFGKNAVEAWLWLRDIGGTTNVNAQPGYIVGSLWNRSHAVTAPGTTGGSGVGFIRPQEAKYIELGGQLLLKHQAQKIKMNGKNVAGVIGSFPEGVFEVKAKAVIMATGGFGGNWDMLEEYQPNKQANYNPHEQELKWANIKNYSTTNSISAATGEGLMMVKAVGASLYQMDQIQLLPGSNTAPGANLNDTIYVNELGKRIVNESGRRDELSLSYIAQEKRTGGSSWAVGNRTTGTTYADLDALGTALLTQNGTMSTDNLNTFKTNFTTAVDNYNASFLDPTGTPDWAGKLLKYKQLTAPWVFTAVQRPYIHHTMGGIEINGKTEVLTAGGAVIPGLYAAGECIGGLHGANRIGGNALGDIVIFGRIAGKNAAEYIK